MNKHNIRKKFIFNFNKYIKVYILNTLIILTIFTILNSINRQNDISFSIFLEKPDHQVKFYKEFEPYLRLAIRQSFNERHDLLAYLIGVKKQQNQILEFLEEFKKEYSIIENELVNDFKKLDYAIYETKFSQKNTIKYFFSTSENIEFKKIENDFTKIVEAKEKKLTELTKKFIFNEICINSIEKCDRLSNFYKIKYKLSNISINITKVNSPKYEKLFYILIFLTLIIFLIFLLFKTFILNSKE